MLDTINTVNFNSKVYNSVTDQDLSAGMGGVPTNEGLFGDSKLVSIHNSVNQSQDIAMQRQ